MKILLFLLLICNIGLNGISAYKKDKNYEASGYSAPKYSSDAKHVENRRQFENGKLEAIWMKAQSIIPTEKSQELLNELKSQEKEYNQYKSSNKPDKATELKLKEKLTAIKVKYGLLDNVKSGKDDHSYKTAKRELIDELTHDSQSHAERPVRSPKKDNNYIPPTIQSTTHFTSERLNNLWKKIKGNYTAAQWEQLRQQFILQQERIDKSNTLFDYLDDSKYATRPSSSIPSSEGSHISTSTGIPNLSFEEIVRMLRDSFIDTQTHYKKLQNFIAYGVDEKPFTNKKAIALWKLAQANNFTPVQLESIRGDILDYEMHIQHLANIQQEFALLGAGALKQPELEEKIQKYARKVEKIEDEIQQRIFLHHDL